MFNFKKFLPKILVSSLFLAIIIAGVSWNKTQKASAEANISVSGYAWSDIIGWINFNPAFGGVFYNNTTGQLSGYAWSDNIGWIYFGPDKSNISASTAPNEPKQWAKANTTTGVVNGWAKTYRAIPDKTDANAEDGQTLGGWEGWIKMDHGMSNPVSIDFTTGDFHGWAWSSDTAGIIGWVSFNSKDCDLDNNGFIDIACGGKNDNTMPAYPYKVTIGSGDLTPTYTIEPSTASISVGGTQRFIGYYDPDGSGVASSTDKTLQASYWNSSNSSIAGIATTTGQAIASCSTSGAVSITSAYNNIPATAILICTTGGGTGATCSDGIQNQNETGIDTGGVCGGGTGGGGTTGGGGGGGGTSTTTIGGGGNNNKEIGTITITPNLSTIRAIINEGLPANSETTTLTIDGCPDKNVTLTATSAYGTTNFSKNPVANGGTTIFSVKNIPGNTEAKTYPIEIRGTASGCSDGVGTVNLKVERTGSTWQEF